MTADITDPPILGLGSSQTRPISCTPCVNLGLPMEELDLEFEQQLDQELEGPGIADDGDVDALQGNIL